MKYCEATCDLAPLHYFQCVAVKEKCCVYKPEKIKPAMAKIRDAIAELLPGKVYKKGPMKRGNVRTLRYLVAPLK